MNALKLNAYVFEKIVIKMPSFPGKKGKVVLKVKVSFRTAIYRSEKSPERIAVRLEVSARGRNQKANDTKVQFNASIVGVFRKLDKSIGDRVLARKIAAPILYDILLETTSKTLNHAVITGFHLPPKLDQ